MKILVTGPRGFVGARIMAALGDAVGAPSLRNAGEEDIRRLVDGVRPDLVIHTAAISDIRTCENDAGASWHANVLIPVWLARTGVKTVAFSTDQVYGGCAGDGPFAEDDAAPVNLYARHKLEMERRTLEANPDTVLLRATWMYDMPIYGVPNRSNFLMGMLLGAAAEYSASQYRGITYVREAAEKILQAALLPGGVYNYGSGNSLSTLETARYLRDRLGLRTDLRDAGPQPSLRMDCARAESRGIRFCSTAEGLDRCLADYGLPG